MTDTAPTVVSSGATISKGFVGEGESLTLYGSSLGTTISGPMTSGGSVTMSAVEIISSGGFATGDKTLAVAQQIVLPGGQAVSCLISGGEQLLSGGSATATTVEGYVITSSYQYYIPINGSQIVTDNGVATNTSINATLNDTPPSGNWPTIGPTDVTQTVQDGGKVYATTLSGGSILSEDSEGQYLLASAIANQYVNSGGSAYNDIIGQYASATITSGGVIDGAVVSGTYTNNSSYAEFYPYQSPYPNINDVGREIVQSGGIAINTDIQRYGEVDVASGGIASGMVIDGGTLVLSSGAILKGPLGLKNGILELPNFAFGSGVLGNISPSGVLTLSGEDGTETFQLAMPSTPSPKDDLREDSPSASTFGSPLYFTTAPNGQGTDVVYGTMCYGHGTHILTPTGERPVETLRIGDRVLTHDGSERPIRWIGKRAYDPLFAKGNRDILPILVRQGALGNGLPHRDLTLSPLHALYIDRVLVPVLHLVNGYDIAQIEYPDSIRYFHIELETHDLLVAEGTPAESFLDEGDRFGFHNAQEYADLYPGTRRPERIYCAPRIEHGPILDAIRRRLDYTRLVSAIDVADTHRIEGWAFLPQHPSPLLLDIHHGTEYLGTCLADLPRPDVQRAITETASIHVGFSLGLPRRATTIDPRKIHITIAPLRRAA